jgi:hypothetical protein
MGIYKNIKICEECYYVVNEFHVIVCRDCSIHTNFTGVRADLQKRGLNNNEIKKEIKRLKKARKNSIAKNIAKSTLYNFGEGETTEIFGRQFPINEGSERFYE